MKKIEYKIEPFAQKLRKEVDDKKFLEELKSFLDKEGEDGWELIKIMPISYFQTTGILLAGATLITLQRFLLVFKREKE